MLKKHKCASLPAGIAPSTGFCGALNVYFSTVNCNCDLNRQQSFSRVCLVLCCTNKYKLILHIPLFATLLVMGSTTLSLRTVASSSTLLAPQGLFRGLKTYYSGGFMETKSVLFTEFSHAASNHSQGPAGVGCSISVSLLFWDFLSCTQTD